MSDNSFVCVTFIRTTPEKLWEALTTNEFLKLYWFGSRFETDWKVGSSIKEINESGKVGFHGEILESDQPNRLSYSFITADEIETVVTYKIESAGDIVTLTTTHVGYEKGSKNYQSTSVGWAAIHSSLKTLLETGESLDKDAVSELYGKTQESGKNAC